jgi:hypothetical protein
MTDACESGSLAEDRAARSGIEQFTATSHLTNRLGVPCYRQRQMIRRRRKPKYLANTVSSPMRFFAACRTLTQRFTISPMPTNLLAFPTMVRQAANNAALEVTQLNSGILSGLRSQNGTASCQMR